MKYREVKKALNDIGFKLEFVQTGSNLDTLSFTHKNIDGEIFVEFCYDVELPPAIEAGEEEFDYETAEFLMDLPINLVDFHVDISISYCSEGVLDTYGATEMNIIGLFGEDIDKYLHKVCDLFKNPDSLLDFQIEYNNEFNKFAQAVKKYSPILRKYNLTATSHPANGNESTLYRSVTIMFGDDMFGVNFYFDVLSWKTSGHLNYGMVSEEEFEKRTFSLDLSPEEFEKMFTPLYEEHLDFQKKYEEYVKNGRN